MKHTSRKRIIQISCDDLVSANILKQRLQLKLPSADIDINLDLPSSLMALVNRQSDTLLLKWSAVDSKANEIVDLLQQCFPKLRIHNSRLGRLNWTILTTDSLPHQQLRRQNVVRIIKSAGKNVTEGGLQFKRQTNWGKLGQDRIKQRSSCENPVGNFETKRSDRGNCPERSLNDPNVRPAERRDSSHTDEFGCSETMSLKSIKKFSHDIKTPLTVIRGFAEILHDGAIGELNPEQRTMVRKLQIRIDEVDSRVNDLVLGP